ncbi:MAG: T9SS type A sorting domain-containing protein, partial [Saprospiraceae bacterium]|nr:T9SS type A sorting domain-containing protein [Saprospiraceae bacterium]
SVSVAFSIQGGTAPYSVTYKVNGANTTLSGYQPNAPVWHTPIVTTVFQLVSITDAIGCQVMPTGLQDTVQIRPAPTFSGLTANPAQVCQGEQVTITATGLLPGQNTTFQYTLQPGGPAVQAGLSGANGSYSFQAPVQPPGFYTLSINAIQVNGCTLAFSSGNSTTFRVQATPSVSGISVADATVCAGTVVEVLAYGLPPDVPATFVYSVNGVAGTATVQTVTTGTAVFISSEFQEGAYTVQLTQVMVAGCTANVLFSAGFAVDPLDEDCGLAIGGRVATEQGAGVEETRVTLSGIGPNGPFGEIDFTDSTGAYRYVLSVPPGSAYTLTPFKNDNPLNGVTTFDLVQISKHILGLERLSSPYKIIAADANRSGSVTTFDIVEFRKLILGIYSVLPNNNSWRFVDKAYVFPDTLNPFSASIPGTIMEDSLTMNALSEDFVGIKVGDVNGTAIPNFSAAAQSRDGMAPPEVMLRVSAPVGHVQPGDRLAVRFEPGEALEGFQFTLENEGLALQEVIADDNLELAVWDGAITASWIGVAQEEEGGVFTLIFQANRPGDLSRMLAFSNRVTVTEAYRRGGQGQPAGLALQWEQQDGPEAQADWLQSSPNPFAEHTRLTYHLPEAGDVVLTVHDELGRMVFRQSGIREAGRHTQVLDRAACPVPGVYVCTLETAAGRRQLKVVKVR